MRAKKQYLSRSYLALLQDRPSATLKLWLFKRSVIIYAGRGGGEGRGGTEEKRVG